MYRWLYMLNISVLEVPKIRAIGRDIHFPYFLNYFFTVFVVCSSRKRFKIRKRYKFSVTTKWGTYNNAI